MIYVLCRRKLFYDELATKVVVSLPNYESVAENCFVQAANANRNDVTTKTPKRRSAFRRANRPMPRRRIDIAMEAIDYKNPDLLKKFVTESGKILPRRVTGMPAYMHRKITREIKRSRSVLLMK